MTGKLFTKSTITCVAKVCDFVKIVMPQIGKQKSDLRKVLIKKILEIMKYKEINNCSLQSLPEKFSVPKSTMSDI